MAGYSNNPYRDQQHHWSQDASYNFEVPPDQFGQELNFQNFAAEQSQGQFMGSQMYDSNPYLNPASSPAYQGNIFTPMDTAPEKYGSGGEFDDEPPLMEELGINPEHIFQKTPVK
ncbi:protein YIPF5-like [Planococcus citri]|uniref:protein YIPF5-like n=1 Tax=Planococcus citri TaxID=170843 RepID=UPI0031F9A639